MKRAVILAAVTLGACSPQPQVADTSWQVTDIWTAPDAPSALPPQDAGRAWLAFGEQSLSGNTGCSRLQGTVTFGGAGDDARAEDAETLRIDRLEIEPVDATCTAAWTHGRLVDLLQEGAEFDVSHSERFLTLTQHSEEIDPPAIGLAAL